MPVDVERFVQGAHYQGPYNLCSVAAALSVLRYHGFERWGSLPAAMRHIVKCATSRPEDFDQILQSMFPDDSVPEHGDAQAQCQLMAKRRVTRAASQATGRSWTTSAMGRAPSSR